VKRKPNPETSPDCSIVWALFLWWCNWNFLLKNWTRFRHHRKMRVRKAGPKV